MSAMRTSEAIAFFGSQAELARALRIKPPSIAGWGDQVPKLRQLQIERLTKGKLRADPSILQPTQESAALLTPR
jgi:DNA-binding transcriptional regulator YdaS (Cro superfamily)